MNIRCSVLFLQPQRSTVNLVKRFSADFSDELFGFVVTNPFHTGHMKSNASNPQDGSLVDRSLVLFNHLPQPGHITGKEGAGSVRGKRLQSVFIASFGNAA